MPVLLALLLVTSLFASEVTLHGKKIHYISTGNAAATLILIHGWACDSSFFSEQIKPFSATYRVIAIDLPGHGESQAASTPLTMDLFAQAVEAVRLDAKAVKPVLIGHSMGAAVARQHARLYPHTDSALIFLDGSIFQLPPGEQDRQRWSEMITAMAKSFGPANEKAARERAISVFLSNMYSDSTSRELRIQILGKVLATSPETAEDAMLSMADLNLWRDDAIDLPVLALRAGQRKPPNEVPYLKSLFPRIQYKFMPGVSHFLMLEKPIEVNAEINTFLRSNKL